MSSEAVVQVEELVKVYPGGTRAVDGLTFDVTAGELVGFLGPNGAGKTTTIRILATLLQPTSGRARVDGVDVGADPAEVRRRIGFAMQSVGLDDLATGREHLELMARLRRLQSSEVRRRASELLELMGLSAAADKLVGRYSGGMRRRLDLAMALIHRPRVLFLDEPTEGLDPQSRNALWGHLRGLNDEGVAMLLTTHYMEEADQLADRVCIIDEGKLVAEGSPDALKRAVGSDVVRVQLGADDAEQLVARQAAVADRLRALPEVDRVEPIEEGVAIYVRGAAAAIAAIVRRLDEADLPVGTITMASPTLDDVFLRSTGRSIRDEALQESLMPWAASLQQVDR
jgi:daunorubicin resistance ABC transporter ATP-binding subunit